jgi:hypothetical protein
MFFIAEGTVQIYDPDDLTLVNVEVRPSAPLPRPGSAPDAPLCLYEESVSSR